MAFGLAQKTSLKRIAAEKELMSAIAALEKTAESEANPEYREALLEQLNSLKERLASGQTRITTEEPPEPAARLEKELLTGKLRLAKILIERYAELLNEKEQKTVGGIKALVGKDDLTIQSLATGFAGRNYVFEKNYLEAAEKAYNYVVREIDFAEIDFGVSFWLSPREIASEKIGDDEDQAIFLCSLLYALGDEKAECVIAELENAATHAFVITQHSGKFLLLDTVQKKPFPEFAGEKSEVLQRYSYNGNRLRKLLYKFNHENYERFGE